MRLIEEIALHARLGDLPAINDALSQSLEHEFEIARGRARADTLKRRDEPLPPLPVDPLQEIAAYNLTPRPHVKKRRRA